MPRFSRRTSRLSLIVVVVAAVGGLLAAPSPVRAQDAITKEAAAALKASFIADLDTLQKKYVGLAEAFPPEKYHVAADGRRAFRQRSADARRL